jgi:hypothetical protein
LAGNNQKENKNMHPDSQEINWRQAPAGHEQALKEDRRQRRGREIEFCKQMGCYLNSKKNSA